MQLSRFVKDEYNCKFFCVWCAEKMGFLNLVTNYRLPKIFTLLNLHIPCLVGKHKTKG